MTPEYAAALLALIELTPDMFAEACAQIAPDDAETLSGEIIDYLSTEGGEEEDATDGNDPNAGAEPKGEKV